MLQIVMVPKEYKFNVSLNSNLEAGSYNVKMKSLCK
jgi:hypothetical protein